MNKQRKTSHILNVFQYDVDGHVVLPASLTLTVAPASNDNSGKVGTTAWVRSYVTGLSYLTGNQSISVSGDATGSGTTAISLTLANSGVTAGTYGSTTLVPVVTVDAKGRITNVTTAAISGSLTFTGDVTGSGTTGTSTGLTLAASGVTAGTYTKVNVDTKGRVTVGASATTSDISEGTNLYYTDARVLAYLGANNYATQSYVSTQINNLVSGAPGLLDTLDELAAALGDDANFATTTATSLGNRLRIDTGAQGLTSTQQGYGRTNLGLGSLATLSSIGNSYITDLAWSKLSSTPTTISGYGITNAYTDAQIQNFFNGANAISGYNKTNWDTAYGWGNHASAGYLTTSSAASTYVSLTGSYANPSWITSLAYSKLTGVPAFLTSYTETDTLATVTARGASTSSSISAANFQNTYQVLSLNNIKTPGLYNYDGGISGTQPLGTEWYNVRTIELGADSRYSQFVMPYNVDRIFYRRKTDAGFAAYVELYHTGNLPTIPTNTNQLTNGAGYITGYTETDTLATVVSRGATTTSTITINKTGTLISHAGMSDAIGYNSSYGTYIGSTIGGTYYIYANGQMYNNGPIVTLLHSGNYSSYALPLSGGTMSGTIYFTDTTNGIYKSGGRFTVRSESTDNVANFASYGLYLPAMSQTAGLYVESPIEARTGLRMGSGAGNGTITVGADTSATANRLVQRDSGGDIYSRYSFAVHFNASCSNNENPSIGGIWANSTSDNYLRKSTPAHFISQLSLITTSNYSSYSLPLSGGVMTGALVNNTDGAVVMESNASENNNWLWKENSKAWGLFWFNRGSQSGQTIGGYSTVGAELMFMGGGTGIAMPSGWTGYQSGSYIAAMISNYNGYIYSASTVFAAGDMRAPIFYDSNDTAYYLNPAGGSRLRNLYVGDSGDDWSDPGGWGTQVRFSNGPHVRFVLHARTPGIEAGMYVHTPGSVYIGSYTSHDVSLMFGGTRKMGFNASYIYTDVYLQAAGSLRAPIFYDSDDTGYYLDMNSTSNSAGRIRGGILFGPNPTWGRYLQVGGNGNQNTDYASVVTTDGNLHLDSRAGNAMYLNYYANGIIYLNGATYYISSNGSYYNGTAAAANSVAWGNVSSKPSHIMYYQSFTLDANTMDVNATGFTYGVNAPHVGPIVRFSAGGAYDMWLNAPYSGGGNSISFRTRNGDTATLNPWREIIHTGNIASQKVDGSLKFWATSHPNDYYLVNNWTGTYWRITSNHPSGVQVAYADSAGSAPASGGNSSTVGGYSVSTGGDANTIPTRNASGYLSPQNWIQFNGNYGLYFPNNYGMHFYPNNDGSYGAAQILGEKNGWRGLHFGGGTGMTLMMNEGEFGFHRQAVGWTARFTSGRYYGTSDNTVSISSATGGSYTWTDIQYFLTNNGGQSVNNSNSAKLQAYSTGNNSAFMSFHKSAHYAVNFGLDDDNVMRIGGWSAGANRWQLDMSGNMTVAGDVTAYSDARVKENVHTVENALDKTLRMRGVTYNRTDSDDKKTKVGVIAQEMLEVLPEVVNQDNAGMYNVSYGNIVGVLVEAIKEQQGQIEELKRQINYLVENK